MIDAYTDYPITEYGDIVPLVAVTQDDYYESLLISKTKPVYRHRDNK